MDVRATTPSAPLRWLRDIFLMAQPPPHEEWTKFAISNFQFQISNFQFRIPAFQSSLPHLLQHRHHLLVNPPIRSKQLSVIDRKRLARKVRHTAAGFFDDNQSSGRVPWEQIHLPKSIHAAQRGIAHIERRRATTQEGLALDQKGFELSHDRTDPFTEPIRKSGHD